MWHDFAQFYSASFWLVYSCIVPCYWLLPHAVLQRASAAAMPKYVYTKFLFNGLIPTCVDCTFNMLLGLSESMGWRKTHYSNPFKREEGIRVWNPVLWSQSLVEFQWMPLKMISTASLKIEIPWVPLKLISMAPIENRFSMDDNDDNDKKGYRGRNLAPKAPLQAAGQQLLA